MEEFYAICWQASYTYIQDWKVKQGLLVHRQHNVHLYSWRRYMKKVTLPCIFSDGMISKLDHENGETFGRAYFS